MEDRTIHTINETKDHNYYKDTPPLEFISDLYDIMKDGDCLTPENLVKDVVDMLKEYLAERFQPKTSEKE